MAPDEKVVGSIPHVGVVLTITIHLTMEFLDLVVWYLSSLLKNDMLIIF